MAGLMAQKPSEHGNAKVVDSICMKEESRCIAKKWYFDRKEIECHSPSRKDGIDLKEESYLRKSYCSFLQELGMKLKVPQVTIATAVMICHRFYMGQSHAKNDWQTVATVGLFLACKIDDTPRFLNDLITLAYEMMYKWDPSAPKRIRQREYFSKQKELILIGERLFLSTIAFDLDIQLPYKPLIAALRKLGLFASLGKVAWNFVNDWIQTTLCLEYRPHYVAAGSLFLAAKFQKVKLPTEKGKGWWLEFDVSPKQLEEITQQMLGLLEQNTKQAPPPTKEPSVAQYKGFDEQTKGASPQSCISSVSTPNLEEARELGASEISSCSVLDFEDGETHFRKKESDPDQKSNLKCVSDHDSSNKIDLKRISDKVKRMKRERAAKRKVEEQLRGDNDDGEAWIERELESGIEIEYESSKKKHRIVL